MKSIEVENLYDESHVGVLTSEVDLWRAVISKALEDLKLPPTNKRYRTWRKQAYQWFLGADHDFLAVCEMAQLSPQFVLESVGHILKHFKY